jgi:hypothetical protein
MCQIGQLKLEREKLERLDPCRPSYREMMIFGHINLVEM